jgi:asparaginyl-tRNA synthetase
LDFQKMRARLKGWVRNVNRLPSKCFAHVNDGLGPELVQAVVPRAVSDRLHAGSAVRMRGDWLPSRGAQQPMELAVTACTVLGVDDGKVLVCKKAQTIFNTFF